MVTDQQFKQLEDEVLRLRELVRVAELTNSSEVPKVQAPYEAGTQVDADGVIPVIINGVRYNMLVNTV